MKKVLFIALPVLALALIAGVALTESDHKREARNMSHEHTWVFGDGGYRLGVILSEVRSSTREKLKIDSGVAVEEVLKDSPAEKAGIKNGDILLEIDGKEISHPEDVRRFLRDLDEAKKLNVELMRDGKSLTLSVTPEKREMTAMFRGFGRNSIGVELQDLDSDLASYFKVDPGAGVLVTRVEHDSPAEKAAIRSGDVITQWNGEKIKDADDLGEKLDDVKEGETAEITVLRHGAEKKLSVQPERKSLPHMRGFEIPDIPEMREGFRELRESPEFRENMEDLKMEMEQLKKELEDNLKPEMEKLKKQLEELKKGT